MSGFPFDLDPAEKACLGLIVLHVDETIESDFRRIFSDPSVALYVTRIPSGAEATPETLGRMEADLPRVTALLPPAAQFAAVGYGCTSGTTMIGVERVTELVGGACRTGAVCNPLSAARAACRHLGIRRLGLVSPYRPDVAQPVCDALASDGTEVTRAVHFGEAIEANVARISAASVKAAAREVIERRIAKPLGLGVEEAALGILRIAVANMGRAIRAVSTEKGHRLQDFALFAYGGAGPLHAAAVAVETGMKTVIVPAQPGASGRGRLAALLTTAVAAALEAHPEAVVTDVGSVKTGWLICRETSRSPHSVQSCRPPSCAFGP